MTNDQSQSEGLQVHPQQEDRAERGIVIFKVTNTAAIKHDFSIKGRTTRKLSHGQSATLRVTFLRKGHYPYKCTVDHHAALGMKGVFTIS